MLETLGTLPSLLMQMPDWVAAITGVITAASAVTALTPTPKDDRVLGKLYRIVEIVALNIGHAKEKGGL